MCLLQHQQHASQQLMRSRDSSKQPASWFNHCLPSKYRGGCLGCLKITRRIAQMATRRGDLYYLLTPETRDGHVTVRTYRFSLCCWQVFSSFSSEGKPSQSSAWSFLGRAIAKTQTVCLRTGQPRDSAMQQQPYGVENLTSFSKRSCRLQQPPLEALL